ncbi:MAG: MFS transporter [Vicinamibacterales bacterium]
MPASLLVQIFASLGHGFMHMLAVYFYLVVLPLEREWGLPYGELIRLWTVGSFLVGAMAIPAGWLADRWSARGMMVVFFLGLGSASIVCALATGPTGLWAGLCLLGSFAAIYHPVGIPWLVRTTTEAKGRAIGINGIFGSGGVAGAGAVAGLLIDYANWRVAFLVPGAICLLIGLAMLYCVRAGLLPDEGAHVQSSVAVRPDADRRLIFRVLFLTMAAGAIVYQAMQAVLPKVLSVKMSGGMGDGALGVGVLVGAIYGMAALTQIVSGHLADRFPLKAVYASAYALQIPLLSMLASAAGLPFVVVATLVIVCNTGALPAENLLLSQSASSRRQGVAFGAKFVMSFGATPIAIWLVSLLSARDGGLDTVFLVLAGAAALGTLAALVLPGERRPAATPAPSEARG